MKSWEYDGSIGTFPVKPGELWSCASQQKNIGRVMAHDLYDGLPDFMRRADCIFTDPPYNAALENGFRSKAGKSRNAAGFNSFLDMFFARLAAINPHTCFFETGQEWVDRIAGRLWQSYPQVEVYPATYYRKTPCFIVRAGQGQSATDWAGMDESDIIAGICRTESFEVIGDLCMGRGALGRAAWAAGRQFCGTELNPARLAVLLNHIHKEGGVWDVDGTKFEPTAGPVAQPGQPSAVGAGRAGLGEQLQPE